MQVSRITRTRNSSHRRASRCRSRGAMHGALGSAKTVPGVAICVTRVAHLAAHGARIVGVHLFGHRRGELHALADAGPELRVMAR